MFPNVEMHLPPCHTCCSSHRADVSLAKVDADENLVDYRPRLDVFAATSTLDDFDRREIENCAARRQVTPHQATSDHMSTRRHRLNSCRLSITSPLATSRYRLVSLRKCPTQNCHCVSFLLTMVGVSRLRLSVRL